MKKELYMFRTYRETPTNPGETTGHDPKNRLPQQLNSQPRQPVCRRMD
ncbi:hypothetical protein [Niastella vici]|nr:hypothetical protein [Niastella vici]